MIQRINTVSKDGLDQNRNYIGNLEDVLDKARLFENKLKTNGHIFVPKVVAIVVEFNRRMELTLAEMKKLLFAPTSNSTQLIVSASKSTQIQVRQLIGEVSQTLESHCTPAIGKEI